MKRLWDIITGKAAARHKVENLVSHLKAQAEAQREHNRWEQEAFIKAYGLCGIEPHADGHGFSYSRWVRREGDRYVLRRNGEEQWFDTEAEALAAV